MKTDSRKTPNRTMRAPRTGFSLVEMLIVIVVMGLVMSILAPRLKGATTSVNVGGATQELTTRIAIARQTAIRRGTDAILHVENDKAWLMVDEKGVQSVVGDTLRFVTKYGVYVTPALDTIRYNPRGFASLPSMKTYTIVKNGVTQKVCVSGAGLVLSRGCTL